MRLQAIIFDMDGVIFESESLHCKAWVGAMASFGHAVTFESVMQHVGVPCKSLATLYEKSFAPRRNWQEYLEAKRAEFHQLVRSDLAPFESLPAILERFAKSVPLGLATSSEKQDVDLMLDVTGMRKHFHTIITHGDVTMHKPDPEPYLLAARRLGVDPANCVAMDDSPAGVASAKAAGMLVLGINTTFAPAALVGAKHCFPDTIAACHWLEAQSWLR